MDDWIIPLSVASDNGRLHWVRFQAHDGDIPDLTVAGGFFSGA